MAHKNKDDGLIRRYLLGQLSEDERDQLEEKMMADNDLFNAMLLAEDEIVEQYLDAELSRKDRASFERSFLTTRDGRRQVALNHALEKLATGKRGSFRQRLEHFLGIISSPLILKRVAIVSLVLAVAGAASPPLEKSPKAQRAPLHR